MSIANSICKWSGQLVLGLALASAACSKKVPEPAPTPVREAEKPAPSPVISRPIVTRVAAAPAEPAIDPALVPVEEDFRNAAEQKLTNKSDLRAELRRIEREISAPSN